MKGKLYKTKPLPPKDEIFEYFSRKEKPWKEREGKEYNWKTSIPDKWVSLKGESFFHHVSELNRPKLSIDLLQNCQQFVGQMNNKKIVFKSEGRKVALSGRIKESFVLNKKTLDEKKGRRLSLDIKPSGERALRHERSFSINVVDLTRPGTKEARCSSAKYSERSNMKEFFERFEKKPDIPNHGGESKGLFGWKLKTIKASKRRRNSFCSQKDSELNLTFRAIRTARNFHF